MSYFGIILELIAIFSGAILFNLFLISEKAWAKKDSMKNRGRFRHAEIRVIKPRYFQKKGKTELG
jgi:hypothetical protein